MITGRQIRAARGLLGWDATDLAAKAGLTRETVSKIENNSVQAREGTLHNIQQVFEASGLEFLDFEGVRTRPEGIHILQGRDGLISLMEDIYNSCRLNVAGEIVLNGVSEDDFERHLGEYDKVYLANMAALPNVRMRCLIEEGDDNVVSSAYSDYRWSPKGQFKAVPFYVYADKLAIIVFDSEPIKIFIIQSKVIGEAYRHQFDSMWNIAKEIPRLRKS